MSVESVLDAKEDAVGAVSAAWELRQGRPHVPMELQAEGAPPQPRLLGSESLEA